MPIEKMQKGLAEYHEKLRTGEVQRTVKLSPYEKAQKNPKSYKWAVVAKCFECSADQKTEVTNCTATLCPLWNLRPWQKKGGVDAEDVETDECE